MRYVMFFVSLGMFMLVACPQQRLPELRPQPPAPGNGDSTVKTVRPSKFDRPSALNPGGIVIELDSGDENIEELSEDEHGNKQYSIRLETDYANPWVVKAGAKDVATKDIMLASFPNYGSKITVFTDNDAGFMKVQRYSFQMKFKEDQVIEPMELYIVARNKSYCTGLIKKRRVGQPTAEKGIEPSMPEKEADCDTMNDGNLYNFDQKIRLQLLVDNVQSSASALRDVAGHEFRQTIFCRVFQRIMDTMLDKAVKKWGSSNDLIDLGQNIVGDFAKGFFKYKMALSGYDCSQYTEQGDGNRRTRTPNNQAGDNSGS